MPVDSLTVFAGIRNLLFQFQGLNSSNYNVKEKQHTIIAFKGFLPRCTVWR